MASGARSSVVFDEQGSKQGLAAGDKNSMMTINRALRYVTVPRGETVFEYLSEGDLFYMVLGGEVLCKIPINRQLIQLTDTESEFFEFEMGDDLRSIKEATEINKLNPNAQKG